MLPKRITAVTLIFWILLQSPLTTLAQEILENAPPPVPSDFPPEESGLRLHVQGGIYARINQSPLYYGHEEVDFQLAWNLYGMKWDKKNPTWGLGGRCVVDNLGFRIGPAALWRHPLGSRQGAYWQIAGGLYLYADEGELQGDIPGYFLEAEIAPNNLVAFSLVLERLNYQYPDYSVWSWEGPAPITTGSDTGIYAGMKLGQWAGLVGTGLLFGVTIIAFANSDWN